MIADHFSKQAGEYRKYRPGYPAALYDYLASLCPDRKLAWDCGTGNGQAASALAAYFEKVIATDPSADQLDYAEPHDKVEYLLAAETCEKIPSGSVDLATAAQAVHWFDFERYYTEVRRVLRPQGIVAVWTHALPRVTPAIDAIVQDFHRNIVGPYWPPQRFHVDDEYRSIPFPFVEIPAPRFTHEEEWALDRFIGYLSTWSSVKYYREQRGSDPIALIRDRLLQDWQTDGAGRIADSGVGAHAPTPGIAARIVRLPVSLRVGTMAAR